MAKEEWRCKNCKGADGLPLRNDGRRKACRRCNIAKGSCFKDKVVPATPSVSLSSTQAEQPRRPGARKPHASSSNSSTEAKLRQQVAALTAENKQLKVQTSTVTSPAMEVDQDGSDSTSAALQADIDRARAELRVVQHCEDHVKTLIPDYDSKLAAAKDKLEAALAAKRSANPLKKQMESAENHQGKLTKKVGDAKLAIEAKREEVEKSQAALREQEAAVAELQEALAKADTQIA